MAEKSEVVRARVSSVAKSRLKAVAAESGLSPSDFLRLMIDQVTEGVDLPESAPAKPVVKRERKVTARLTEDVAAGLGAEAQGQGVAPSTWAASILMAKYREAPQPVKSQRGAIGLAEWPQRTVCGQQVLARGYCPASSRSLKTSKATLSGLIAAGKPPYSDICQIASAISVLERPAFSPPSM